MHYLGIFSWDMILSWPYALNGLYYQQVCSAFFMNLLHMHKAEFLLGHCSFKSNTFPAENSEDTNLLNQFPFWTSSLFLLYTGTTALAKEHCKFWFINKENRCCFFSTLFYLGKTKMAELKHSFKNSPSSREMARKISDTVSMYIKSTLKSTL